MSATSYPGSYTLNGASRPVEDAPNLGNVKCEADLPELSSTLPSGPSPSPLLLSPMIFST